MWVSRKYLKRLSEKPEKVLAERRLIFKFIASEYRDLHSIEKKIRSKIKLMDLNDPERKKLLASADMYADYAAEACKIANKIGVPDWLMEDFRFGGIDAELDRTAGSIQEKISLDNEFYL